MSDFRPRGLGSCWFIRNSENLDRVCFAKFDTCAVECYIDKSLVDHNTNSDYGDI